MSSGCMVSTPQPPRPPALATAIDSDGGQAPAIGASRTGTRSPKREQNDWTRSRTLLIDTWAEAAGELYTGCAAACQPPCRRRNRGGMTILKIRRFRRRDVDVFFGAVFQR